MTMPAIAPPLKPLLRLAEFCVASAEVAGVGVIITVRTSPVTVVTLVYIWVGGGVVLGLEFWTDVVEREVEDWYWSAKILRGRKDQIISWFRGRMKKGATTKMDFRTVELVEYVEASLDEVTTLASTEL